MYSTKRISLIAFLGLTSAISTTVYAKTDTSCASTSYGSSNCGSMNNTAGSTVTIAFTADQESQQSAYKIEKVSVSPDGKTWTYQVSNANSNGKALSHWALGIANCAGHVTNGPSIGTDGSTGFLGMKWDTPGGTFSFTLDAAYKEAAVQTMAKTATVFKTGNILGPDCSKPATPPPPTSGTIGGYSGFNNWGQCQSTKDGGTKLSVVGRLLPTAGKNGVDYNDTSVKGEVYNNSDKSQTVTLVTYKEFYAHENFDDIIKNGVLVTPGQRVHDYETVVIPAKSYAQLTADMPGCSTQIDLVCADVIQYLGGGNLYGQRKLAYAHPHQPNNGWCSYSPPVAACTLKMDKISGVTDGQMFEPGTQLNFTPTVTGGTPSQVTVQITNANGTTVANLTTSTWNTTGIPEGSYTAKVSIIDASGKSCDNKTVGFSIVRACPFNTATITGVPSATVQVGSAIKLGANVSGGTASSVKFEVTDVEGNIVSSTTDNEATLDTVNYGEGQYTVKMSVFGNSPSTACQTQQATFHVERPCKFKMPSLTGVANGNEIIQGGLVSVGATVTDGTPSKVNFKATGPGGVTLVDYDANTAPYVLGSNLDTNYLAIGSYTITATAFDQFGTACATQEATFSVKEPPPPPPVVETWSNSFKGGFTSGDQNICQFFKSATVDVNGKPTDNGWATPQWIEVPVWVETYNSKGEKQGGLKVKLSGDWYIVHPTVNATASPEIQAANAMVCPDGQMSSDCNAGQSTQQTALAEQVFTSDENGRVELTLKGWWPGVTPEYIAIREAKKADGSVDWDLMQRYPVENHYGVTVRGDNDTLIVNLDKGQAWGLGKDIFWYPHMIGGDCTLTKPVVEPPKPPVVEPTPNEKPLLDEFFSGQVIPTAQGVTVTWQTSDTNAAKFIVKRDGQVLVSITDETREYTDANGQASSVYEIEVIDMDGTSTSYRVK